MDFESGVKRLEEIAGLLEKGDLSLDEAMKLFEEGTRLSADCSKRLKTAELKITEIGTERQ